MEDTKTYKWNYTESVTFEEFVKRIYPLINGPVTTLSECDGDMWLTDLQKLHHANDILFSILHQIKKEEKK